MIRGLKALGKTILLTTHYMDEAEQLADRLAIMSRGRLVYEGTPRDLIRREPASLIRFRLPESGDGVVDGVEGARLEDGYVRIETPSPTETLRLLTTRAHDRGLELPELTVSGATLEDMYLKLVGETEMKVE
jgi:ABC-2 type transport system ATP-binding protein